MKEEVFSMGQVQHLIGESMFVVGVGSEQAQLKYRLLDNAVIEYYSTFVPDSARGKGIAKILVDAGVEFAKSQGYKILPTCWYVEKYFSKHSELEELRASNG